MSPYYILSVSCVPYTSVSHHLTHIRSQFQHHIEGNKKEVHLQDIP
ncbi:MAG TPA: hypothetical protein VFM28_06515 [Nitrososphaeraceae archaeon]|nr:hypothetical protein [Nitrososphaeraceae archaeon]